MGETSAKVIEAKMALEMCQAKLDNNHTDSNLRLEERQLLSMYLTAARNEEIVLKQKSRIQWLKEEDQNTSFFFKSMVNRRNKRRSYL